MTNAYNNYSQVSFYARDMFLKMSHKLNTKFPFKTLYFLGFRGLTASSYILYLRESSAHPFRVFLGPKNWVCITIDGALDAHTKSETTISLSVESS